MGVFKGIKNLFSQQKDVKNDKISFLKFLFPNINRYGVKDRNNRYWGEMFSRSPRLHPVRKLSQDVASVDWYVADSSKEKIENHELQKLISNPNPFPRFTWYMINYIKEIHLLLSGEAFILKNRDVNGKVNSLWNIPPAWLQEYPCVANTFAQSGGKTAYYTFVSTDGSQFQVHYNDIIYFFEPNVNDPYVSGVGQAQQIADEIETDEYMSKYIKKFFLNDAIPSVALQVEGVQREEAERLREEFQQKYNTRNTDNTVSVLPFDAKIQLLKETNREMDFIESRKFLRDACIQNFAIPPEILGIIENSNRSTIESAYYLYSKSVLTPRLKLTQDVYNSQLVSEFDSNIKMVYKNIIPSDDEFILKRSTEGLTKGAITVNEWRHDNGRSREQKGRLQESRWNRPGWTTQYSSKCEQLCFDDARDH